MFFYFLRVLFFLFFFSFKKKNEWDYKRRDIEGTPKHFILWLPTLGGKFIDRKERVQEKNQNMQKRTGISQAKKTQIKPMVQSRKLLVCLVKIIFYYYQIYIYIYIYHITLAIYIYIYDHLFNYLLFSCKLWGNNIRRNASYYFITRNFAFS